MNHKYIVKKPFKYGKKRYQQGDEWTPDGGNWDMKIPESGLVTLVREPVEPVKKTTGRKRGAK